ncbi:EAL domain-containing protein [Vibrio parahaemolyticus]|uniref:EAL domain-containing protein n=1 Tax=Vibrio parahaemolyticus TaxID=670 RepID=UPI002361EA54|nr:EAL domain-containing protein [Vibrio parahaemolyticus]
MNDKYRVDSRRKYTYIFPLLFCFVFSLSVSFLFIKMNLNNTAKNYINKLEDNIHNVEKEMISAIKIINNCKLIGKNLLYSNNIRELLIIENQVAICSSKRGKVRDELILNYDQKKSGYRLIFFDVDKNPSERTLALISPELNDNQQKILSIIDKKYLTGSLFDIKETNIDKFILKISNDTYPVNSTFSSSHINKIAKSQKYNFSILIDANLKFIARVIFIFFILSLLSGVVLLVVIKSLKNKINQRGNLALDFREGLSRNEFFFLYQPIINSSTRKVEGLEALVRWNHPTLGLIMPDIFIPIAEESRMINELTNYALKWILKELSLSEKTSGMSISINIPPTYLSNNYNLDKLKCYKTKFSNFNIQLIAEITERQLLDKAEIVKINQLRKEGLTVAVDDFGTGHTSLSVIQDLDFNYLKIDKCFIDTIGLDTVNSTVLDAIIQLGKRLGVVLIAEGVETKEQFDYLANHGVEKVQGYYFSQPIPLDKLELL